MTRRSAPFVVALLLLLPHARPVHGQPRAAADLGLASQTAWVRSEVPFTMRLDVDRVRRLQQLDLIVTVHRAVTSRSQFARTIDGDLLGSTVHRERVAFSELRFDAAGALPVTIDLPQLRPGVYPISVELLDTRSDLSVASLVTHLVRVPDDPVEVPLAVAWVQAYGADPALQPDGTTTIDGAQLDGLRVIAAQLDEGVPLTVIPTPETIAALEALDDGRTTKALARLLADHQVVSTPFVDLDVTALVDAGRNDDLARQRLVGGAVLHDALGVATDTFSWSLDGPMTDDALAALTEVGVRQVVVDEAALEPLPSSVTAGLTLARPFALPAGGTRRLDAVAVDRGITKHFDEPDAVLAAHHLIADLAVLHFDSPGTERGIVVRPPQGWLPSEELLSTAIVALASSPIVRPVTLDQLLDAVSPLSDRDGETIERELAHTDPAPFGFAPGEIDQARAQIASFASLTDRSNADLVLFERLVLFSEAADLRARRRLAYLDAVQDRVADSAARVRVLGDRTYRLTARAGTIPITLVNDNPFSVHVTLELTSDKLEFGHTRGRLGSERIEDVELAPSSATTRAVPVKARTSGAFPLRVSVRSPDGRLDLGRTQITITSTVASGVGVVLSGGAALFLLLWWARHWRTTRRARRLVPAE